MVNKDQIEDSLERGWIVVVPDHRLCPQVDIANGPMEDIRDLLLWIYDGHLDGLLSCSEADKSMRIDRDRVMAFGTSSGGTLALALVSADVPLMVIRTDY